MQSGQKIPGDGRGREAQPPRARSRARKPASPAPTQVRKPGTITRELAAADLPSVSDLSGAVSPRPAPAREGPPVDLMGVRLDNLMLEKRVGQGGMGDVWKARDTELDISVAVKVLPPHLAGDPQFLLRFMREARAVAKLDHPNIVRVYQAGPREHDGQYLRLMVMEFVDGMDAQEAMYEAPEGRLPPGQAAQIVLGVARALRYAHGKGVIHRDIKPANLLIPKGDDGAAVKVLDFGLAHLNVQRLSEAGSRVTNTDAIVGTPQYISPEQAQGRAVDSRCDIYSLGITFFELLTGRIPFEGGSPYSLLKGHVEKPLEFPPELFEPLPALFKELIGGMCAKAPEDRLPLKQVIEKLEQHLGIARPAADTPPVAQAPGSNISRQANSFVGRESELEQLQQRLKEGARLVTVIGAGGIGKTRFAQEFALNIAPAFAAGVWFCDLTEARSELGICHGMSQGLSIPLTLGDPIPQIHAALRMRGRMLVILDNFEQVADHAAATLGVWLKDTPHVTFLATSREPLRLAGEWTFPLDPLAGGHDAEAPAIRLFCDRAREVRKDFALDDDNREAVERIVQELDGIPLALELAAARVSAMPPQKILERLPQRFDLLTSRRRDASDRQMTLRGAIDWSWNLLAPWEQLALAQCSVFRDGYFLEAAEAVLDVGKIEGAPAIMDIIDSLVEKSLMRAYEHPSIPGEARYRMFESVRGYAERKMMEAAALPEYARLTGPDAAMALRERHGRYYVNYARHWDERIPSHDSLQALNRISAELDNLFEVQDGLEVTNAEIATEAILAAARTLRIRGPWPPRVHRLERALRAIGMHGRTLGPGDSALQALRVRLFTALALALYDIGSREGMVQAAREAVGRAKALGPKQAAMLGPALSVQGMTMARLGEPAQAAGCFVEAEQLARKCGNHEVVAYNIGCRGLIHAGLSEFDLALECYDRAESTHREIGDLRGVARNVGNRGTIQWSRGEYDSALASFSEAEAIARNQGDQAMAAINIGNRGMVHYGRGEYDEALECYSEAESLQRIVGDRAGMVRNIVNRGNVQLDLGRFDQALACYQEAEAFHRESGNRAMLAIDVGNRGAVHLESGGYKTALVCFSEEEAIGREIGDKGRVGLSLARRGACLLRMDRIDDAADALAQAEEILRELGFRAELCDVLNSKVRMLISQSTLDAPKRVALLQQALAAAEELFAIRSQLGGKKSPAMATTFATLAHLHDQLAACFTSRTGAPSADEMRKIEGHRTKAVEYARQSSEMAQELALTPDHYDADLRQSLIWIRRVLSSPRL